MSNGGKQVQVGYFAVLREDRGLGAENVVTQAQTLGSLYEELKLAHGLRLRVDQLKFALNDEFVNADHQLKNGDHVVFIPPVAGG